MDYGGEASVQELSAPQTDSMDAYRKVLEQYAQGNDVYFVCSEPPRNERQPRFNQTLAERAAAAAGFNMIREFPLPDGRKVRLWERKG